MPYLVLKILFSSWKDTEKELVTCRVWYDEGDEEAESHSDEKNTRRPPSSDTDITQTADTR